MWWANTANDGLVIHAERGLQTPKTPMVGTDGAQPRKKHHVDDTRMFPAGGLRAHHRWQCPQRRMPAWVNMLPDETWLPFTSTKRHFSPGRGGNRTEPENISSNAWHRSSFERASDHSTSELPSIPRSPPQPTQRRPPQRQHARIRLKSQWKTKNISFPGRLLNRHCLPFALPSSPFASCLQSLLSSSSDATFLAAPGGCQLPP